MDHFSEITVAPGDYFSLRCVSRGSPLAQIDWSLDRLPIASSTRYHFGDYVLKTAGDRDQQTTASTGNQQLLLVSHFNVSAARVEDGGLYRCTGRNVAGVASYQARVNVIGKGAVKVHTPNVTALTGTDIELNCPYYGAPIQSISWFGRGLAQPINE